MSGFNDFAPHLKRNGCFVVRNVAANKKVLKIFHYPVPYNSTRDLLQIPGVSEADIRASLLKGTLLRKILAQEIVIECSDIDLLQFNDNHKLFLQNAGIVKGLEIDTDNITTNLLNLITSGSDLRSLLFYIDEGPAEGVSSGAFKEVLGVPFISSSIWYTDSSKTIKILEKLITRDLQERPITITWNLYNVAGTSIIKSVTDTITYVSGSFESTRSRSIS